MGKYTGQPQDIDNDSGVSQEQTYVAQERLG